VNTYGYEGRAIDSVDLKCLLVSRGVKVDRSVYRALAGDARLSVDPLKCDCLILSDETICQLTDMAFHLEYLSGALSWNNLKLLRYASELHTPFSLRMENGAATLYCGKDFLDAVSFPPPTDFYERRTESGLPFRGNAVLQGLDWVAFQCMWACEYAAAGEPCEFCFSGAEHEALATCGKPLPPAIGAGDVREIATYAVRSSGMRCLQITGGSTFDRKGEAKNIISYLTALEGLADKLDEYLLYITPPADTGLIDEYFRLGAGRVACSLELWDEGKARIVTPGKMRFTTRERHLAALRHIAGKHGAGKAFTNFIIGIEEFDTLSEGAKEMASRGVLPTAAVWMPMGRPVLGKMKPPDVDFYRRVKELFAELYDRYGLEPPRSRGLNVCIESDIARWSASEKASGKASGKDRENG
jgi:hypothetical protein